MNDRIRFEPRWKEELHCWLNDQHFAFEMTMGEICIYIPEEQEWESQAPGWAKGKFPYVVGELKKWAESQNIPVAKSLGSWVDFETVI